MAIVKIASKVWPVAYSLSAYSTVPELIEAGQHSSTVDISASNVIFVVPCSVVCLIVFVCLPLSFLVSLGFSVVFLLVPMFYLLSIFRGAR